MKIGKKYGNSIIAVKVYHSDNVRDVIETTLSELVSWLEYHGYYRTANSIRADRVDFVNDIELDEGLMD